VQLCVPRSGLLVFGGQIKKDTKYY